MEDIQKPPWSRQQCPERIIHLRQQDADVKYQNHHGRHLGGSDSSKRKRLTERLSVEEESKRDCNAERHEVGTADNQRLAFEVQLRFVQDMLKHYVDDTQRDRDGDGLPGDQAVLSKSSMPGLEKRTRRAL